MYLRRDRTIDAVGVTLGHGGTFRGGVAIGDPARRLFGEDEERPAFEGELVELTDGVLYFLLPGGLGLSAHLAGCADEDGPFTDEPWQRVLGAAVTQVVVARHDDKRMAY